MKFLSKQDLAYAIITGLTTGLIIWLVLRYLEIAPPIAVPFAWLPLIVPVLWIVGVQFGYFLGIRIGFFNEFGKFVAIGFTNFAVDTGVLNLLIATFGIATGAWYAVFKAISFVVAVTHSYFWNRRWTFQSVEQISGAEFFKFFAVMAFSILVNVAIAFSVVHFIAPSEGVTPEVWANVGAVIGSACALIFSFAGFRLVVFKNERAV